MQAWNYYENFPKDPLRLKLLVSLGIKKIIYDLYLHLSTGACNLVRYLWRGMDRSSAHRTNRLLDTVHLVVIIQSVYHYLVTNWGFAPALNVATWELVIHIFLIGLSCFICQIFFLQRCAVPSNAEICGGNGAHIRCV